MKSLMIDHFSLLTANFDAVTSDQLEDLVVDTNSSLMRNVDPEQPLNI